MNIKSTSFGPMNADEISFEKELFNSTDLHKNAIDDLGFADGLIVESDELACYVRKYEKEKDDKPKSILATMIHLLSCRKSFARGVYQGESKGRAKSSLLFYHYRAAIIVVISKSRIDKDRL